MSEKNFNQMEESDMIGGIEEFKPAIMKSFEKIDGEKIVSRIWDIDYTVWKDSPEEISNRLGWLQSPESTLEVISEINHFVDQARAEGFTHALLLGMGGSSLAPEVFRKTFGVKEGYLDLEVLDSTDPGALLNRENAIDMTKTLFIVSTKSGGTIETMSFMKYFYTRAGEIIGKDIVGKHFIAITDPGSGLESLAKSLDFRKIFLNDPNIGGRYSALSFFGMLPAALIGVDIRQILTNAIRMANECKNSEADNNPGVWLGIVMGELAKVAKEKVTFIISPELKHLGGWLEQLIAESTGKEGVGILPVDGEELLNPENYSNDRLFVSIQFGENSNQESKIKILNEANFPIITIKIEDLNELGAEFFRWEFATIIACKSLGINPFDQPNVESAKVLGRKMVAEFQEQGKLPQVDYNYKSDFFNANSEGGGDSVKKILINFLQNKQKIENQTNKKIYVAIQAYLTPSAEVDQMLQKIRTEIQNKWNVATTLGYGPRFLHSTGQLHKGDSGNGMFIQILGDVKQDLQIPDEAACNESSMSFGTLIKAQALGDRQALLDESRNVLLFNIGKEYKKGLSDLLKSI
jgi:glucose-6-phosphate isomerase